MDSVRAWKARRRAARACAFPMSPSRPWIARLFPHAAVVFLGTALVLIGLRLFI
jgi:hypothetical protein